MAPSLRNKWDTEQRTALHAIHEHFNFEPPLRTKVFNTLFKDHLAGRGFADGIDWSTLRAQYCERYSNPRIWADICKDPANDEEWRARNQLTAHIRDVTEALDTSGPGAAFQREEPQRSANSLIDRYAYQAAVQLPRIPTKRRAKQETTPVRRSKRSATVRSVVAVRVSQLPGTSSAVTVRPATPQRTTTKLPRQTTRILPKTIPFIRPNGPVLNLTPPQIAEATSLRRPIPPELAHRPALLLYRYVDEKSFGMNSIEQGCLAGRYVRRNVPPRLPTSTELDLSDIFAHLNREKEPSPFISASNCLLWLVNRVALKELDKGAKKGTILFIDPEKLVPNSYFHVKPFHKELQKSKCFTNGAWRYTGEHEMLIFYHVPPEAIVSSLKVSELLEATQEEGPLSELLRLESIRGTASFKRTVVPSLENKIELGPRTVVATAKLCRLAGFTGASSLKILENIVADVVQGWRIVVPFRDSQQWTELAGYWVHILCGRDTIPAFTREQELKMAFLFGVKAGLSDFNTFFYEKSIVKMQRLADRVGLGNVDTILLDAMAEATTVVLSLKEEQNKRYADAIGSAVNAAAAATQALLPGIDEYLPPESDVPSPLAGHSAVGIADEDEIEDETLYDEDNHGM